RRAVDGATDVTTGASIVSPPNVNGSFTPFGRTFSVQSPCTPSGTFASIARNCVSAAPASTSSGIFFPARSSHALGLAPTPAPEATIDVPAESVEGRADATPANGSPEKT